MTWTACRWMDRFGTVALAVWGGKLRLNDVLYLHNISWSPLKQLRQQFKSQSLTYHWHWAWVAHSLCHLWGKMLSLEECNLWLRAWALNHACKYTTKVVCIYLLGDSSELTRIAASRWRLNIKKRRLWLQREEKVIIIKRDRVITKNKAYITRVRWIPCGSRRWLTAVLFATAGAVSGSCGFSGSSRSWASSRLSAGSRLTNASPGARWLNNEKEIGIVDGKYL